MLEHTKCLSCLEPSMIRDIKWITTFSTEIVMYPTIHPLDTYCCTSKQTNFFSLNKWKHAAAS